MQVHWPTYAEKHDSSFVVSDSLRAESRIVAYQGFEGICGVPYGSSERLVYTPSKRILSLLNSKT